MNKIFRYSAPIIWILFTLNALAQAPKRYNSSEIYKKIQKLNILGNALYIAAHPDDENTWLITYLSNAQLVNTAYLSLTRGDGGQNSIGSEQSELLGVVRTQELLSARRVDGGTQFFTRVMDFGYSKSAEETLNIWNKDELLEDVIWIIRKFKPDVIITRFPPDARAGHGQHETSAIVAGEAFDMAGDPAVFPEQLDYVDVWQPVTLFYNIGRWWDPDVEEREDVISVDIGEYDPLSGLSYSELGADSRSQHRSQAFGVTWTRGEFKEFLEYAKGQKPGSNIFDGIDISWNRINRKDIGEDISSILDTYDFRNPSGSVHELIRLRKKVEEVGDDFWREQKMQEIDEIIKACLGLYLEATSGKAYLSPEDEIVVRFEITNRSDKKVFVKAVRSEDLPCDTVLNEQLVYNDPFTFRIKRSLPLNIRETSPFWLKNPVKNFEYDITDPALKGRAQNPPSIQFKIKVNIEDTDISYWLPVIYTWTDRMKGQQYEPLEIGPKLFVEIENGVFIFPDEQGKQVHVKLETRNQPVSGKLTLQLPDSWKSDPVSINFNMGPEEIQNFQFKVFPPQMESQGDIIANAVVDGKVYDRRLVSIDYEHFPRQLVYLPDKADAVKLDIKKRGSKIAYIIGAGDDVGTALEQIGYEVSYFDEKNISDLNFSEYDAVVFGIMAFNNQAYLSEYNEKFLDFIQNGGNVIVQYNNIRIGTKSPILLPYPIEFSGSSASVRVSVENAEVRIIAPNHEVMNYPNKINTEDFNNWVQERGLYFPVKWDEKYSAILSSNDPGEPPLDGGLLVAQYGKGFYIYTSYSWFRQLPAGVPGAYRIFANLISIGK